MRRNRDLQRRREQQKIDRQEEVKRIKKKMLLSLAVIIGLFIVINIVNNVVAGIRDHFKQNDRQEEVVMSAVDPVEMENTLSTNDESAAAVTNGSSVAAVTTGSGDGVLHIVAVGDNVIHEKVYKSADTSQDIWNYDALYANIRKDIEAADLASVNEECAFVTDHKDVSGYPVFGTPTEVGDALVNAGFDIVTMATNHVCDKGEDGILQSIQYWETKHPETVFLGIHKDQEDARTIRTIDVEGITIAMLDYTCLINGGGKNEIKNGMVDYANEVKMIADVQQARFLADFVIVYLHAGTEYDTAPDEKQKKLLNTLLDEGVDLAICSHPHILQGFETMQNAAGNKMLVYYSLGNFISSQKKPECLLGGMADIKIVKDPKTRKPIIQESQLIPLVTHYNYEENIYTVYRLDEYTEELAAKHSIHKESDEEFTLERLKAMADQAINASYK